MAETSESHGSKRKRLEQAISAVKSQRSILGDETTDAAIAALRRERSALGEIESEPDRSTESERRVVTVLFCDVVGSTALGEQLDPEEWSEIMNGLFERLIPAIARYKGTIAHLMGDAVLALFGAPVSHEDDPLRAVLAALDILDGIRSYQERVRIGLKRSGLKPAPDYFEVRIGINSGLAVVGSLGSGEARVYTAMGDAVNLAARMEQTARPGTIQISQNTYRFVSPFVQVEPLGPIAVKGKRDPIPTYRVIGRKEVSSRPGRIGDLASPLVGRQQEMEMLNAAAESLSRGGGQIICLIGEAGMGKTRLVKEAQRSISERYSLTTGPLWYEVQSFSFETSRPFGLLRRLIYSMAKITQSDPDDIIRQKLSQLLNALPAEQVPQSQHPFEIVLGLEDANERPELHGEELKQQLFQSMLSLIEAVTAGQPALFVFDDFHWADPATVELIHRLLQLSDRLPLLYLTVFRPYRNSPAWKYKQSAEADYPLRYREIIINPLSTTESAALVSGLIKFSDLPGNLRDLILKRTVGVPFFIEETIRDLIERRVIIPAEEGQSTAMVAIDKVIDIAGSLEAVLVARMDRLDDETRHTLQLAAVIGRTFHYRVLVRIASHIDQLDRHLRYLQQVEMIREISRVPELEYAFNHVLSQEAAYNTILLRRRRLTHQRIGEAMEELFADRLQENAPLLAHHFHAADDDERALQYFRVAAESASLLYANEEAVTNYTKAIEAADRIAVDPTLLADLHRGRALAYDRLGDFDRTRADNEAALYIGRQAGDQEIEWRALLDLGKMWAVRDYNRTGEYFEQASELARRMDDGVILARSLIRVGNWYTNTGQPGRAIERHQEALTIFESLADRKGLADTLDLLGMDNIQAGDFNRAATHYDRAIDLYRELDDLSGLASSLAALGFTGGRSSFLIVVPGVQPEEILRSAEEALRLSQKLDWRSAEIFAYNALGFLHLSVGQIGKAFQTQHRGLQLASEINHYQWMAATGIELGVICCELLNGNEAKGYAERALVLAREIGSWHFIYYASAVLAKACLILKELEQSKACLRAIGIPKTPMDSITKRICWAMRAELALAEHDPLLAAEIWERIIDATPGKRPDSVIPSLWRLRGQILADLGHLEEAETVLQTAIGKVQEMGAQSDMWRLQICLGQIYRTMDRDAEAAALSASARAVIDELAATLPDGALRKRFLRRTLVLL